MVLEPSDEKFAERLGRGPAALLLGQRHLALGSSVDPLLDVVRRKLNAPADGPAGYNMLLADSRLDNISLLDWLDNRSRQFAASEHLDVIAQYPWIGVWASAIDSLWADAFETSWREVQKVFSESYRPTDPRNRHRLHCTFLFGSTSRSELEERPPLSRLQYLQRRGVAQALARRILPVLGPTGTLAIEGYGEHDWLSVEDLVGILAQTQPGQCHLFSASDELASRHELRELAEAGLLTLHRAELATVLHDAHEAGVLELGTPADEGDLQRIVSFDGRAHSVPRDLWVTFTSSAQVLDEATIATPSPLSKDALYAAFRRFLGSPEGRPDWEGVARGFAFEREFEPALTAAVERLIRQRDLPDRPIVLHGATGTGKTTALAVLALRLAQRRSSPIMFIDRRSGSTLVPDVLDRFCKWAEEEGARASVLVWDGMLELDTYEGLAQFFASRGRRVVIVGSSYRLPDAVPRRRPNLLAAPSDLSPDELERLSTFLAEFDERLARVSRLAEFDSTFLVYLYRLLPPTRAAVRSGVLRELERTERSIVARATSSRIDHEPGTALGWALLDAGLLPDLELGARSRVAVPGEQFSVIEDLTSLIMVAAQFGLAVPLELLLRTSGREGYANLAKLLDDVDLVRWIEDPAGNYLLGARSRLEAQLIARTRLGTLSAEVAYAKRLLLEVVESDAALSGRAEMDFAIDLVRSLGAQGPNPDRYLPEYLEIASALRQLREDRGVSNPRLMLQEANLLREWSFKRLRNPATADEYRGQAITALLEAADVLAAALDLAADERRSALRNRLHVELSATLATRANALASSPDSADERAALFDEARRIALEARAEDQGSYYPVDVLAWSTRDVLNAGLLDSDAQAEATAEVFSAFELLDPDELDASQVENYHKRRQEFADLVGEVRIADDAFESLLASGSGAGVYLRARAMARLPGMAEQVDSDALERISHALDFLAAYEEVVLRDVRCLNLRFDLWWFLHSGQRSFADERHRLAFDSATWARVIELLRPLEGLGTSYRDAQLQFLRGLAEFHLGDYSAAFTTFEEVERRSEDVRGRRRIVRAYLASTPAGEPIVYRGTISSISRDQRRGEVYVDELRRRLTFIPSEFGARALQRGDNLGGFHIAFNFLGIIADPTAYLKSSTSR